MEMAAPIFIFELNPYNPATCFVFNKHEKPIDRNANLIRSKKIKDILCKAELRRVRTNYTIFFPDCLRFLLWAERYLCRIPIGAHYYVMAIKKRVV